ncbi:hypothetical protein AOX56_00120 [Aeromonas sobria]|uniref:Uncharacterized protein n=1 Tax=Aeromonas sobria TaxID=646 RepID=A0A2N3J8R3_AERSO|nr:hypothetical protein [Aeromonas sobria]PKQ82963.1 hypothetical protein AOX56_00120 [Aeromonas sobria]
MKEATIICDALLEKLASVTSLSDEEQICDSDPQIDQHTPLPLAHFRELSEGKPERRGREWKRTRNIQVDLYQPASAGRAGRDQLLSEVLAALVPSTAGIPLPGTSLLTIAVGNINLEPEEVGSDTLLTSIQFSLTYTASL